MHKIDSVTILKNQISFDKNIFEAKMYANLLKHIPSKMKSRIVSDKNHYFAKNL